MRPLEGRRVLVTRTREQAGTLAGRLAEMGAAVLELPVIALLPPADLAPLDDALRHPGRFEGLVFTSANAVRVFARRLAELGLTPTPFRTLRTAAIGGSTAAAVRALGLADPLLPAEAVGESLAALLSPRVSGGRVLLVRAAAARDVVPDALRAAGAALTVADAYRTAAPEGLGVRMAEMLDAGLDAVTFTSTSTVRNFFSALAPGRAASFRAVSIGPVTSAALRERGIEPAAEAAVASVEGLAQAVVSALSL
jgi:uroporphyrinogen-III synthase